MLERRRWALCLHLHPPHLFVLTASCRRKNTKREITCCLAVSAGVKRRWMEEDLPVSGWKLLQHLQHYRGQVKRLHGWNDLLASRWRKHVGIAILSVDWMRYRKGRQLYYGKEMGSFRPYQPPPHPHNKIVRWLVPRLVSEGTLTLAQPWIVSVTPFWKE